MNDDKSLKYLFDRTSFVERIQNNLRNQLTDFVSSPYGSIYKTTPLTRTPILYGQGGAELYSDNAGSEDHTRVCIIVFAHGKVLVGTSTEHDSDEQVITFNPSTDEAEDVAACVLSAMMTSSIGSVAKDFYLYFAQRMGIDLSQVPNMNYDSYPLAEI